ncbi:hypothetical protein EWE75_08840 [Sphingomonas populi]|uniref:Uncharacterized protein n=1 Tax=Sphingomonas populi TaxID=2484750 RepID=A0A4Q6XWI1_9SPHN|nr:hypothetical protein [Sphingomonas populi]RZF64720.1 hypothetical protein EWE75_08840 [Sphingomonas populi]
MDVSALSPQPKAEMVDKAPLTGCADEIDLHLVTHLRGQPQRVGPAEPGIGYDDVAFTGEAQVSLTRRKPALLDRST